jgi:hypothetical protein
MVASSVVKEAERGQEVALHKGVAASGRGEQWHTGLTQCLNVAVDGALARLEGAREVFGTLPASALQFQHDG